MFRMLFNLLQIFRNERKIIGDVSSYSFRFFLHNLLNVSLSYLHELIFFKNIQ